jgi:MFS family permease
VVGPVRAVRALVPPAGLARSLSVVSALYAVGSGVFLAGNAVFFTQVVGLSPGQVGVGLSVAGVVAFLVSVPAGRLADRVGARRVWWVACAGEGLVYLGYPWVRGFGTFLGVVVLIALLDSAGSSARGGYTLAVIPRGERVRTLAFVRSALNTGFTLGALASGIALSLGHRRVESALPLATGVLLLVTTALVRRLPPTRVLDAASPGRAPEEPARALLPVRRTALRNRPFLVLSLLNGQVGVNQVLLTVVFPLWLVERTDAPHAALAWLYGTNTVLAVLFQVRAARGCETLVGALRAARVAAGAVVVACTLAMLTHWSSGWPTVAVLWTAYVAVTAAELFSSAASWGLVSELTDPARRAEYQGAWKLGTQFQAMVGPALCTWLAVSWSPLGFLVVAALAVAAAAAMPGFAAASARVAGETKPVRLHRPRVDTIGES